MTRAGIVTRIDRTREFLAAVDLLTNSQVKVGVPQNKDARREADRLGNADIGYLMENGAPEVNLPARPHLVPGVRDVRSRITDLLKQAGRLAFEGRPDAVMRALNAVGLTAQSAVKARIRAGVPPPLAESTLAGRRARGRTGTKPLIDTGQYLAAISYVIEAVKRAMRRAS
jgi:hypothetical protein